MDLERLHLEHDRRLATVALGLLLLPAAWFLRTDFALYAGDWVHLRERLLVRGAMVAALAVGLWVVRRADTSEAYSRAALGVGLAIAGLILAINGLRPRGSTLPLRTPLVNLVVMYGTLPNRFWRQAVPPLLLSAGLIALRVTWVTSGADGDIAGDVIVLLIVNALGMLMVSRRLALETDLRARARAEREALAGAERALGELRTLRGIIPICMHCKKVRTEVGDWQQIERYVRDHSEANFSHGICPDCVGQYFRTRPAGGTD